MRSFRFSTGQRSFDRCLMIVLFCIFGCAGLAQAPANGWPQFRGSSGLLGTSRAELPANLKLLWTYDAGDSIESSAAIVDGVVYVGSQSADLISLDLATGKLLWKYHVGQGIEESSPAVSHGSVYGDDLSGVLLAVYAS